ncbi:portal protein [Xylella fastidiosa]|uniref:portal protein n=1 Tax=Xylella fastidiosa TaxID=2371 RepID=UPI003AFA6A8B
MATFNYVDNLAYAVRYTYEILVDMIPRVYDTPRAVRVLGEDGGEKWKQLYQEVQDPMTGRRVVLNDIGKGKYDVTVTVGPSYATQRMEAAEAMMQTCRTSQRSASDCSGITYAGVQNMDFTRHG